MQRHLNKQGGGRALYRGLGSIAFVALCRFAMLVGRDPLMPDRCVLAQVRNSLAGPQPSLAYRINAVDGALPTIDWLGPSPFSADDLLIGSAESSSPRDLAGHFLRQFLAAGPRTCHDIWDAAQKAGLSERTCAAPRKPWTSPHAAPSPTTASKPGGSSPARNFRRTTLTPTPCGPGSTHWNASFHAEPRSRTTISTIARSTPPVLDCGCVCSDPLQRVKTVTR